MREALMPSEAARERRSPCQQRYRCHLEKNATQTTRYCDGYHRALRVHQRRFAGAAAVARLAEPGPERHPVLEQEGRHPDRVQPRRDVRPLRIPSQPLVRAARRHHDRRAVVLRVGRIREEGDEGRVRDVADDSARGPVLGGLGGEEAGAIAGR